MSRPRGLALWSQGVPMLVLVVAGSLGLAELQRTRNEQIDQRNGSVTINYSDSSKSSSNGAAYEGRGDVHR